MAMKITTTAADAALNAIAALLNSGTINIYSGTEPSTAGTALSGNTLLATLTFGSTAFGSPTTDDVDATARKIVANSIGADSAADASGTATFFRAFQSGGTTVVYQGTVGTSGQQLNLNDTALVQNGNVSISSLKITLPTA